MKSKFRQIIILFLSVAIMAFAGCISTSGNGFGKYGLEYELQTTNKPRINRIHVLKLDLTRGKVTFAAVMPDDPDGEGPAESALTNPYILADDPSVIAFVNANPWRGMIDANSGEEDKNWREGQPVDIIGLAASGNIIRSKTESNSVSLWIDNKGKVIIGDDSADASAIEGIAGFKQILIDGAIASGLDMRLAPRTSIGLDEDGKTMWLVVVDGRQAGFSEGVNCRELASIMRDLGCWNAVNMDGGGSSIMGIRKDGELIVMNCPSDRDGDRLKIRPVPIILTIRTKR